MKGKLLILLLGIVIVSCNTKTDENNLSTSKLHVFAPQQNWINFKYDRIIAFATVDPFYRISNKGNLIDLTDIKDTISITLTKNQIETLDSLINGNKNISNKEILPADCFNPRHNIIFLNNDTLVNYISVCYECGFYRSSKPNIKGNLKSFKAFFDNLGLKVFNRPDYHSKYYDSIIKLRNHNL